MTCSIYSFGFFFFFFFFFPPLLLSILLELWILTKLLSFFLFLFFSITFFIVVINLCLYIGLLQFWGVVFFCFFVLVFFFSLSFFNFNFFNLPFFGTFIPLFAFPTVLFPLQLIFNICKSSLSTSLTLHIYSFFLYFLSFSLNIFVRFIFIALFPNWHLALVWFSSLFFN